MPVLPLLTLLANIFISSPSYFVTMMMTRSSDINNYDCFLTTCHSWKVWWRSLSSSHNFFETLMFRWTRERNLPVFTHYHSVRRVTAAAAAACCSFTASSCCRAKVWLSWQWVSREQQRLFGTLQLDTNTSSLLISSGGSSSSSNNNNSSNNSSNNNNTRVFLPSFFASLCVKNIYQSLSLEPCIRCCGCKRWTNISLRYFFFISKLFLFLRRLLRGWFGVVAIIFFQILNVCFVSFSKNDWVAVVVVAFSYCPTIGEVRGRDKRPWPPSVPLW